jgi:tetratricopeptide (TPR) repeat protein
MDTMVDAYEEAIAHARRAGLPHQFKEWRAGARLYGSTPVVDLLAWLDEQEASTDTRACEGVALAMLGRVDEARTIMADVSTELADRGAVVSLAAMQCIHFANLESLAGDHAAAAKLAHEGCRHLDERGEKGFLSTGAANLALALCALDRLEEAEEWTERAATLGAAEDAATQMLWRQARAKLLAKRHEHEEAERLAREAVAIGEQSDLLNQQADVFAALGEVLVLSERPAEAAAALEQAIERYERKGNVISTQRAQARLAEIRADTGAAR